MALSDCEVVDASNDQFTYKINNEVFRLVFEDNSLSIVNQYNQHATLLRNISSTENDGFCIIIILFDETTPADIEFIDYSFLVSDIDITLKGSISCKSNSIVLRQY